MYKAKTGRRIRRYGKKPNYSYFHLGPEDLAKKQLRQLEGREKDRSVGNIHESYSAIIVDAYNEYIRNKDW